MDEIEKTGIKSVSDSEGSQSDSTVTTAQMKLSMRQCEDQTTMRTGQQQTNDGCHLRREHSMMGRCFLPEEERREEERRRLKMAIRSDETSARRTDEFSLSNGRTEKG
ncbi:uncharacterized protein N7458_003883 [Penicillium daleae]|uniref:Uncharacterized protein n=1 Tax=Penicillium daleae TaxID=63821 RepID=A0AAD6G431_9EURO|nr:uncharacterized protein N7458_003883 [Penicillium daleae]KAJ5455619.1 hypothetical protein N7458_003883 [Penicillium daleae]